MTPPHLQPSTVDAVRQGWSSRLRLGGHVWDAPRTHLVERPDATAVVIVALGDAVVVLGPGPALDRLSHLPSGHLLDLDRVVHLLGGLAPEPLGAATLAFADRAVLPTALAGGSRAASCDDAEAVLGSCTEEERAESGLADMPVRLVLDGPTGGPGALAGYEPWGGALAHLGVAVRPEQRRSGLAALLACAVAHHAVDASLVPQWRCGTGNLASAALRDRLGFVVLGRQLAVAVSAPPPAGLSM